MTKRTKYYYQHIWKCRATGAPEAEDFIEGFHDALEYLIDHTHKWEAGGSDYDRTIVYSDGQYRSEDFTRHVEDEKCRRMFALEEDLKYGSYERQVHLEWYDSRGVNIKA